MSGSFWGHRIWEFHYSFHQIQGRYINDDGDFEKSGYSKDRKTGVWRALSYSKEMAKVQFLADFSIEMESREQKLTIDKIEEVQLHAVIHLERI